ncbi:hypothetical protein [Pseudocitrobacter sp. RIT415]|uniref:hypothetical protein n=1 Tax=Pseudocitrobacter sp. RIT415 TaxID=2202163 RepID=UPI0011BF4C9A|nr:hypothetical protein [Pseudocitrobacter sp. RIT 415]
MNFKKIGISVGFNIICTIGATLALLGFILACWFFFASEQEGRFYRGGISLVAAFIGYAIYCYTFPKIHKKWTDRY